MVIGKYWLLAFTPYVVLPRPAGGPSETHVYGESRLGGGAVKARICAEERDA